MERKREKIIMTLMDCIERIPEKLEEISRRNVQIDERMECAEELIVIASGSSYDHAIRRFVRDALVYLGWRSFARVIPDRWRWDNRYRTF